MKHQRVLNEEGIPMKTRSFRYWMLTKEKMNSVWLSKEPYWNYGHVATSLDVVTKRAIK